MFPVNNEDVLSNDGNHATDDLNGEKRKKKKKKNKKKKTGKQGEEDGPSN
jgi:hypothetical protein